MEQQDWIWEKEEHFSGENTDAWVQFHNELVRITRIKSNESDLSLHNGKTVAERTTYFGRSRNGQLSVSSLSGRWLSSQESVGKAATIKQPHDGVTRRDAADVLLTPTSSSLSLSEPTLHRL